MGTDYYCKGQTCEYWNACGDLLGICPKFARNNTTIIDYQFIKPKFTNANREAINKFYVDYYNFLGSLDFIDLQFLYQKYEDVLECMQPVFERELVKNQEAVKKIFEYTFSYSRVAIILILIKSGQVDFAKELIRIMIRQDQKYSEYYKLEEHKPSYVIKEILNCARYQKIYEYKYEIPLALIYNVVSAYYENCSGEKISSYKELEDIIKAHGGENIKLRLYAGDNEWEYPIQELPDILEFDF